MIDIIKSEKVAQDSILLRRVYVDITGDIHSALILAQIIYWNLSDKDGKSRLRVKKNGNLCLVKKNSDWWDECRVPERTSRRCLKNLSKLGIIETTIHKFNNTPMTHIFLNKNKLNQIIAEYYQKMTEESIDLAKLAELKRTDCPDQRGQNGQIFITDTTTDITTENTFINGDSFKKQKSHFISNLEKNLNKIEKVLVDNKDKLKNFDIETCKKILLYYLNRYSLIFNEHHPEIKKEHWERVINDLFINPVSVMIEANEEEDFYKMIENYFQTEFYQDVDYNILHFATEGILDNRFYEACYQQ